MHTSCLLKLCVGFSIMLYNVTNVHIGSLLCRVSLYHAWLKKTIAYLDADYVSLEADTVTDNGEISEVILPYILTTSVKGCYENAIKFPRYYFSIVSLFIFFLEKFA